MSKNNGTEKPKKQQAQKIPPFVSELLKNGTVTITSLTREDIDAMLRDIPEDVKYYTGVVARNSETGIYVLRLDKV